MSAEEFEILVQFADSDGGPIVPLSASDKIAKISKQNLQQVTPMTNKFLTSRALGPKLAGNRSSYTMQHAAHQKAKKSSRASQSE